LCVHKIIVIVFSNYGALGLNACSYPSKFSCSLFHFLGVQMKQFAVHYLIPYLYSVCLNLLVSSWHVRIRLVCGLCTVTTKWWHIGLVVCRNIRMFQLENQWMDRDQISYEYYTTGGYLKLLLLILYCHDLVVVTIDGVCFGHWFYWALVYITPSYTLQITNTQTSVLSLYYSLH
jgi:hypothetical protein